MTFLLPKPPPRIIAKLAKRRAVTRMDRLEKEAVRKRDREACRVCFRKSREVHERCFKSRGGVASMFNSFCVCRTCHQYLQGHAIKVYDVAANLSLGCNGYLRFEMSHVVAQHVFRGRAVPAHVEVIG